MYCSNIMVLTTLMLYTYFHFFLKYFLLGWALDLVGRNRSRIFIIVYHDKINKRKILLLIILLSCAGFLQTFKEDCVVISRRQVVDKVPNTHTHQRCWDICQQLRGGQRASDAYRAFHVKSDGHA